MITIGCLFYRIDRSTPDMLPSPLPISIVACSGCKKTVFDLGPLVEMRVLLQQCRGVCVVVCVRFCVAACFERLLNSFVWYEE